MTDLLDRAEDSYRQLKVRCDEYHKKLGVAVSESYDKDLKIMKLQGEVGRLKVRLEEAEVVVDKYADERNWWIHDEYDAEGYVLGTVHDFRGNHLAEAYRLKHPKGE
jgi:hypothetical protein